MIDKQNIRAKQRNITKQVGKNLRVLRLAKGLSQTELGDALGVSFQQIQKYEKGTNRLSAAALCQIAEILQVPILSFFKGVADEEPAENDFLRGSFEMARHFNNLKDERLRQTLKTLIHHLANQKC